MFIHEFGSLTDWISDTFSQGHTDLQSLVMCLDHRAAHMSLVAETNVCNAHMNRPGRIEMPEQIHKVAAIVLHDTAQPFLVSPIPELAHIPGITAVNGLGTDVEVPNQNDSPTGSQTGLHAALQRLFNQEKTKNQCMSGGQAE